MADNFSHSPKLKRNLYGNPTSDRSTIKLPAIDSSAHYLGAFVQFQTGTALATMDGIEFGVPAWADDGILGGFIKNITRMDSTKPIWEEDSAIYAGTVTAATGELPLKYTFGAANDETNPTTKVGELLEIMPVHNGDILEVSLWGGAAVSVDRATTVAAGTTLSTANMGTCLLVNSTYPFALTESTSDTDSEDMDFMTFEIDGHKPRLAHRVYVVCMRSFGGYSAGD